MEVNRKELEAALRINAQAQVRTMPNLTYALARISSDKLALTSTNLSENITTYVNFTGDAIEKCLVPINKMIKQLASLTTEIIDITFENNQLNIKSHKSKVKLSTMHPDGFIEVSIPEDCHKEGISVFGLSNILSQLSSIISVDDTRAPLRGVNFSIEDNKVNIAATDGKRLSVYEANIDTYNGMNFNVPLSSVNMIAKMNNPTIGFINDTQFFARDKDVVITGRLIEGTYPNYRQIIPASFSKEIKINGIELNNAIKSVLAIDSAIVTFEVKDKKMLLLSNVNDGKIEVELDTQADVEDIQFLFTTKFLKDVVFDEDMIFSFNSSDTPVMIQKADDKISKHILMPLRNQ